MNTTAGKWRVNQRPHGKVSIVGDSGQQVCLMWNSKERDANARLISAAPDMYRALRDVNQAVVEAKNEIDLADKIVSLCHNISQALAKADGGEL